MPIGVFLLAPTGAVVWGQDTYAHKQALKRRSWLWPFFAGMGVQLAGFVTGAKRCEHANPRDGCFLLCAGIAPPARPRFFCAGAQPDIAPVTSARLSCAA